MAGEERESLTRALVEAVRGIRYDEIPQEACETAHHCLLDFLGVVLAGSREPLTDILVDEVVRGEAEFDAGVPAADLDAQGKRLRRKFLNLAAPVLGASRAAELSEAALSAGQIASVAELLRLAQPG